MDTTTKQILTNARSLIKQGWTKHNLHTVTSMGEHYCAVGAINKATYHDSFYYYGLSADPVQVAEQEKASAALMRSINELFPRKDWISIERFNDANHRTKAHILRVFDHAIEHA